MKLGSMSAMSFLPLSLPPANEVCEGYVFTRVCLSTGGCVWQGGMHGGGGMHDRGACVAGGCAWQGVCRQRACMAGRDVPGRGCAWQGAWGVCVVGSMHGGGGGMCAMADTMGYGQ